MNTQQQKNSKTLKTLLVSSVLMFGFGFALVPLYDVFCEITGLNGKVTRQGNEGVPLAVNDHREIRVQFLAINNEAMPWDFKPKQTVIKVNPGETKHTAYIAYNPTSRKMVGQAVPSVSPAEAAQYLHKVNCFCFDSQPLESDEVREMPLLFVIDPELPAHLKTLTLSYTLFDITPPPEINETAQIAGRGSL